jgi:hypothetical protein
MVVCGGSKNKRRGAARIERAGTVPIYHVEKFGAGIYSLMILVAEPKVPAIRDAAGPTVRIRLPPAVSPDKLPLRRPGFLNPDVRRWLRRNQTRIGDRRQIDEPHPQSSGIRLARFLFAPARHGIAPRLRLLVSGGARLGRG